MRRQFKTALIAIGLLATGVVSAQITDNTSSELEKDKSIATDGSVTKSIKLIDNKGTIKYLQVKNGLTQITSKNAHNRTVTTWQLGGSLNANTYIKADDNKEFALDGLKLVENVLTQAEFDAEVKKSATFDTPENRARVISSNAKTGRSDHATNSTAKGPNYGFTVLVRDEVTGAIKRIKLEDLLNVDGIRKADKIAEDYDIDPNAPKATIDFPVSGLPAIDKDDKKAYKLFVFRNGAKLRIGVDFTVEQDKIVLDTAEVPCYKDDEIEVQYIK